MSLIHEKPYPAIVVNEILERAEVGRSAFYAHFPNKDALLANGIEHVLHTTPPRTSPGGCGWFRERSQVQLSSVQLRRAMSASCRSQDGQERTTHRSSTPAPRLAEGIKDDVREAMQRADGKRTSIPADLVTEYIVTTFILVLNWWVEQQSPLSPHEIDDAFLALVIPALNAATARA